MAPVRFRQARFPHVSGPGRRGQGPWAMGFYHPQRLKQVNPGCENAQISLTQQLRSRPGLCTLIEKSSKPARAPGLLRPTPQTRWASSSAIFYHLNTSSNFTAEQCGSEPARVSLRDSVDCIWQGSCPPSREYLRAKGSHQPSSRGRSRVPSENSALSHFDPFPAP